MYLNKIVVVEYYFKFFNVAFIKSMPTKYIIFLNDSHHNNSNSTCFQKNRFSPFITTTKQYQMKYKEAICKSREYRNNMYYGIMV